MATVYSAWQKALERRVAVKICHSTEFEERSLFRQEALLLAGLQHPAIVAVHDFFEEADRSLLVMEYLEGLNLRQQVERQRPPEEVVVGWLDQLLEVLDYLHSRTPPVIFRDLKPENLILDPRGRIRVFDFGIAKQLVIGEQTQLHLKGMGSEYFAPLEQYGQGTTDQRSDYYALGATLYFLLTGQDPMPAWQRLPQSTPLDPGGRLGDFVRHMTALFPQDRPTSPRQLLRGEGTSTGPSHRQGQSRRLRVQVVGERDLTPRLGHALWHPAWSAPHLYLASQRLVCWDLSSDREIWSWGKDLESEGLQVAADGRWALQQKRNTLWTGYLRRGQPKRMGLEGEIRWFHCSTDSLLALTGSHRLASYDMAQGRKLKTFGPSEWWLWLTGRSFLTCCADRRRVIAGASDGMLFCWDPAQAGLHWQARLESPARALQLSEDGHFLAALSEDRTLSLWQSEGGQLLGQWPTHLKKTQELAFVHWLPQNRGLLLIEGRDILAWDLAHSEVALGHTCSQPIRTCSLSGDGRLVFGDARGSLSLLTFEVSSR